jgi:polysaccharide biosynthesis/export protein
MKNRITFKPNPKNLKTSGKIMHKHFFCSFLISLLLLFGGQVFAQNEQPAKPKKINFGYSKNPETKPKKQVSSENNGVTANLPPQTSAKPEENTTIAKKTLEIAKKSSSKNLPLTEVYRVGVGDILFVSLQNAPARDSTYFTVLNDGAIDYPLAGELVPVSGLTTDEIEEVLREKITLYENPQISVRVRDYASHRISVLGLVEKPGDKFIQREAIPLYVVKAEAVVQPTANQVTIRRADSPPQTFSLKDSKTDETLILTGDIVEFSTEDAKTSAQTARFYFIGGGILSAGQKDFHQGLTLSQAILAAGGLRRSNVKQVVVRRKNAEGLLVSKSYNLKEIKDGKIPDPLIEAGDTIEVGN